MCLGNVSEKLIAKEDIVCYKVIKNGKRLSLDVKDGDSFTGIIKGINCKGKISIENNKYYFCTDDVHLDGVNCSNKHGYKYSWLLSNAVTSIIIDGKECMKDCYATYYRGTEIEIGKTYTSEIKFEGNTIEKALHSFADLNGIPKYLINDNAFIVNGIPKYLINDNTFIVKCIIPKNAVYYSGRFDGYKSYASNELKYVEIVNK